MPFDPELRDDVKNHADIVKVISSFLNVTKKGKEYLAICPFHDDTDPSLHISPEKKMFKCFSCGTGGDAISFVAKYLHVSNFEAMKKVAELSDYHDPRLENNVKKAPVDEKKATLIKCTHDLTVFYQYSLNTEEGQEGLKYFESRNLTEDIRKKYCLGYAISDGSKTIQFLQNKGHSLKTIDDIGIASLRGNQYYDRNEGRAIFPICDAEGNVIGYSARRIKNTEEAKYVNSPETYLFHKSSVLYNYHIAKEKAKIAGCIYVLEGFMDVFALSKIGMDNAVALMGTNLTNEHIAMLRKLNVEIRLCLDGDLPGQTATMKVSKALEEAGLTYLIVDNQNSTRDPDEILNEDGTDALRTYLNKLLSRVDFALNYFLNSSPLKTMEQKKKLVGEFVPILLNIKSQLELDNYLRKLSNITGFDTESIRSFLLKAKEKAVDNDEEAIKVISSFHPERKILRKLEMAERELLYQMINHPEAVQFYEQKVGGFYDEIYRTIANFILELSLSKPQFTISDINSILEDSELENKDDVVKEFTDLCFEKNHPCSCPNELLTNLADSIENEKKKIYEEDTLSQSLDGKSELEKARILAEYNRRRMRNK